MNQRKIVEYEGTNKIIIEKGNCILYEEIELKSLKDENKIHPNQDICGKKISDAFNNLKIVNCLVYGMTQTGKTGCMAAFIKHYIFDHEIPNENIYIITGLSDKEWKKDTKYRMPDSINKRVFHRANLPRTFARDIREKKNVLVIMDEIQIACKKDQTLYNVFRDCGFYDLVFLFENDIKIVQYSATPDGNMNDIGDWKQYSIKIKLVPGDTYYGIEKALAYNRVKQYKDLTNYENVQQLKDEMDSYNFPPSYHLIRVPNRRGTKQEQLISNFNLVFGSEYEYNYDYLKKDKDDINDILVQEPNKHTFIFYCEILRCAKTQHKEFIGISYDRYNTNPIDSSIIQGSFGRLTGYKDNGRSICYTNISSLENYIKLWDNSMEFGKGIIWNTNTTKYDLTNDITYSTGTFNSVKNIKQLSSNSSELVKPDRGDPEIVIFYGENGQTEMIDWFKENIKSKMKKGTRGPRKKKSESGFYKSSIRNGLQILSTEEVKKERKWGFEKLGYRSYPCYIDINDASTLQWWLIYYD